MAGLTAAQRADVAAIVTAALAEALTSKPKASAKASQHSIADLRSAGTFTCGVAGHGRKDDGKFATRKGATFHAEVTGCEAMKAVLAKA